MGEVELDPVDRAILFALQEDARNNTNATISDRVDVSASTIGKRIKRLEERGVIRGYRPEIDYEEAGCPLNVLLVCRAPITDRRDLVKQSLEIPGVVNARELMTGEGNVHLQVVGADSDDITEIARKVDGLGLTILEESLVKTEFHRPSSRFGSGMDRQ